MNAITTRRCQDDPEFGGAGRDPIKKQLATRIWQRLSAIVSFEKWLMTGKVSHQATSGRLPTAAIFLFSWFGA